MPGGYCAREREDCASSIDTLDASVEIIPGRVTQERSYGGHYTLNVTSVGLFVGWQYLRARRWLA